MACSDTVVSKDNVMELQEFCDSPQLFHIHEIASEDLALHKGDRFAGKVIDGVFCIPFPEDVMCIDLVDTRYMCPLR